MCLYIINSYVLAQVRERAHVTIRNTNHYKNKATENQLIAYAHVLNKS